MSNNLSFMRDPWCHTLSNVPMISRLVISTLHAHCTLTNEMGTYDNRKLCAFFSFWSISLSGHRTQETADAGTNYLLEELKEGRATSMEENGQSTFWVGILHLLQFPSQMLIDPLSSFSGFLWLLIQNMVFF